LTADLASKALAGIAGPPPAITVSGAHVSLSYADAAHYADRTSDDVEALRTMPGFDFVSAECDERSAPARVVVVQMTPSAPRKGGK
jgi:hypothetical protein